MNANELANELINWYPKINLCVASAITLRQQAKEIEQLKADLNIEKECYDKIEKHNLYLEYKHKHFKAIVIEKNKEIEQLKEIVDGTIKQAFYEDDYHKLKAEYDLLKAHPMRELSDEEMLEVYKKVFNKQNEFKENLKRRSYFDFARAILKKASRGEK